MARKNTINTDERKTDFWQNIARLRKELKTPPLNRYTFGTAHDDAEERLRNLDAGKEKKDHEA